MGYASIALLNFFLCFLSLHLLPVSGNADQSALLAFKNGITMDPENVLVNWNKSTPLCQWTGVVCVRNLQRVLELDLKRKSLRGTISPFLSNLSYLELLELSDNSFHGPIPMELTSLNSLEFLGLQGNEINNEIPHSFGMITKLRFIDLSNNQLHGELPTSLFYNCTQLMYVDLSNNSFTGRIPSEIGNHLLILENLLLYSNQLVGVIPDSLSNCSKMNEIDIENNFLTGILPSETLSYMPYLRILHLSYNNFSSDRCNSDLSPFFSALTNLTHLEELELGGNSLGGKIPPSVALLGVNLSELFLQDNHIHGEIPTNLSSLSKLSSLDLSNNHLNGTIPSDILLLPSLQRLWLSRNFFQGKIPCPPTPSHMNSLGLLDLSRNKLSGSIPECLPNLNQLRVLILSWNILSGTIPSCLGRMKLELLDLSNNMLTGSIAPEVAGLQTMVIYFNLSHNFLEGPVPTEMSTMDKVQAIDLSSNKFTGKIPPNLDGCEMVELLNLSHNFLHGSVPENMILLSLKSLDLSYNLLSGDIPISLQQCRSLTDLNLSYNNFSGELPRGGLFDSLTIDSVKGNQLCGSSHGLPSCQPMKKILTRSTLFLVLLVSLVSVSAFALTILSVVGCKKISPAPSQRYSRDFSWSSFEFSSSYPRITYNELVEATGGFEEKNLIGSGSFGRVYRAVLRDGTEVAVKVLHHQTNNYSRSFNTECQILKSIRHRNLMKIITACSLPDFKALVLPFMANGSLDSHLYPHGEQAMASALSLAERVNICSDIAEGLAYLHHHSPVPVVHCDLKPSNILLNNDMTALVSDFGIARLVMTATDGIMASENMAKSTANLLCGSIGYVAPEYGYGRKLSTKGDVYSFGIIVLEIITQKRPTDAMFSDGLSLQMWVRNHYTDQFAEVVDALLLRDLQDQSHETRNIWEIAVLELLDLGLHCSRDSSSARPSMVDVADNLDRLKRYLEGDTSATFLSSHGISSSASTQGLVDT